jgi:hypothetical protein
VLLSFAPQCPSEIFFFLFFSFRGSNFSISSSLLAGEASRSFSLPFSSFLSFCVETFVASHLPIVRKKKKSVRVHLFSIFFLLPLLLLHIFIAWIYTHTHTHTHVIYTYKQWHPQRPALCRRSSARRRPPLLPREEVS